MKADLHIHTLFSDGKQHPEEVMKIMNRYIKDGVIDLFGITDHYKRHVSFCLRDNTELRYYIKYLKDMRDSQTYFEPERMNIGLEVYSSNGIPDISPDNLDMLDYILIEYAEKRMGEVIAWKKEIEKPVGLPHPDYEKLLKFREDIAKAGIFLELNAIKPTYRRCPEFFRDMPPGLLFSTGSDMHNFFSNKRNVYIENALAFAEEKGLPLISDSWI